MISAWVYEDIEKALHAFSDGWYYLGNDNQWHYTHGVKATMPMYNATIEIINQYKQIREVFS